MLTLPKKVFTEMPLGPVEIDHDVMPSGLVEFYMPSPHYGKQGLVSGRITNDSDAFVYPNISPNNGPNINIVDTGSSSEVNLGSHVTTANNAHTIFICWHSRINVANGLRVFTNDTASSSILGTGLSAGCRYIINSLSNDRVEHSASYAIGESIIMGGSYGGSGTTLKVYSKTRADGIKLTENGSTSTGTYSVVENEINSSNNMEGGLLWFMSFDRQLEDPEVRTILENPWQTLKPVTNSVYFPVGGAVPPTFKAAWAAGANSII